MSAPAAIMASLVDVRNVSAHKCVRLEIHVPVEQAGDVMAAFGWPTAVSPVPVAIARLMPEAAQRPALAQDDGKERKPFHTLPYAQQSALKCGDDQFREFMRAGTTEEAAEAVRKHCGVRSRGEIETDPNAKERWIQLLRAFDDWQRGYR